LLASEEESDYLAEPLIGLHPAHYSIIYSCQNDHIPTRFLTGWRVELAPAAEETAAMNLSDRKKYAFVGKYRMATAATQALVVWDERRAIGKISYQLKGALFEGVSPGEMGTAEPQAVWDFPTTIASRPAVGGSPEGYLVVWQDLQGAPAAAVSEIFGRRVSREGKLLDHAAFPITLAAGEQRIPAVAFGGSAFLVVWEDHRQGSWDIYGTLISADGKVFVPSSRNRAEEVASSYRRPQ
jgi:hypothetical protein